MQPDRTRLLFDTMTAWKYAMVSLVPLQQDDFEAFLEYGIREYKDLKSDIELA